MNYRNISVHAEDTAEGAMLGPGESTEDLGAFDPKNPHNKRLIDEGIFLPIHDASKTGKEGESK